MVIDCRKSVLKISYQDIRQTNKGNIFFAIIFFSYIYNRIGVLNVFG